MRTEALIAIVLLCAAVRPASAQDLDVPYAQRIDYVREWGHAYPGYLAEPGPALSELGLVAGIMLQTVWQRDSGRERLSIWSRVNAGLSAQPYWLAVEYQRHGDLDCHAGEFVSRNPTRDPAQAPITRADVCQAWRRYFIVSDAARRRASLQHPVERSGAQECLWDAHTYSIVHELWQFAAEVEGEAVPEAERGFWAGWTATVFGLADMGYPTTAEQNSFFSTRLMPDCSPLGEGACQVDRFSGFQRAFLALLTASGGSVQSLVDDFLAWERARGARLCAAPLRAAGHGGGM